MPKKILINGITLEGANITPLLLKVREWQSSQHEVTFLGTADLKKQIESIGTLKNFRFMVLPCGGSRKSKFQFIWEALKRNICACFQAGRWARVFDVVYTISPVLDLILLPFVLKKMNRKLVWVTVFDNTVPLTADGKFIAGNKLVRLLAWLFYQLSLSLLKSANRIFVIKPELKAHLAKRGFDSGKLVTTGNGIEKDLIEKAQARPEYVCDALYVGRINEAKGIYDLLNVLERVKRNYPYFTLAIMGEGDAATEKKFKKAIAERNMGGNVRFLGYRVGQEKFDILKSSKIFLFLSETESVPVAPLEAVSSGLKTLVYDLEAYRMYKNEEVLVFKKNDWEAVADMVIALFEKHDFENSAGRKLLNKYSWSTIAQTEIAVMQKI